VHGASRLHDPQAYEWHDEAWTGRQLAGSVIYELHIGTFTPDGTFAAAVLRCSPAAEPAQLGGARRFFRARTSRSGVG
jgi:maltooligosyltrehalose trehalohydrolase